MFNHDGFELGEVLIDCCLDDLGVGLPRRGERIGEVFVLARGVGVGRDADGGEGLVDVDGGEDDADGAGDGGGLGDDGVGGEGGVVPATGGDLAHGGDHGFVRLLAEAGDLAIERVAGGDAPAGGVDADDDGLDARILLGEGEGGNELVDGIGAWAEEA